MESNGAFNPFRGYSRRELKEQDLISQLELGSQYDSEEVDCTLQLGLPSGNGGKRPRIDVPSNIHATPPPQNHGVENGQYGYYNMSMGNLGVSNMNIWAPMKPNGGYYYGSTSAVAATVIPIGYNNAGMYPRTGEPDPRSVPNERICVVCGSTSTPLWRNGPRGAKTLCNACGIRFKNEMRRARGHHGTRSRASMAVPNPNEPGTFTNRP